MSKIKIRKSVFETNSSSTHSIHIDNETALMDTTLLPNEEGEITLTGGEFGWEWQRYNDALTKANYASIESSGANIDVLIQAIIEQTGSKLVNIIHTDWSYIDHQSAGLLMGMNLEELKNWIFNPNCWLVTGNDNSSEPSHIKDFPTIEEDGLGRLFEYTHEIKIENKDITFQIKGTPEKNPERFFEILNYNINNDFFNKKGEEYKYYFEFGEKYNKIEHLKEGYFITFSYAKLHDKIKEVSEKVSKLNIITEKKEEIKSDWEKATKISKSLLKNNFEDFILKVNFSVKKL